ncbi:hypothetical protein CRYUN_Cryun26dG0082900 [Craigia yunnanensis]
MIYHPSLVATIPAEDGKLVLESLVKLISVTKMKSVCNLGVWCISIQQFDAALLAACFDVLLRAVIHALDNPIGSLSTTFEAMQAVAKLAAPLSEMMRESSHLWAPPIYRRLLSIDKRERDMSERCLLKIRSTIFPPPISLSKAIIEDMKKKLLTVMKDWLDKGMKVQTVKAWGWFICFLGSDALKNKHLVNDMLKVPEQTFSDHNPQVQIASLVAWEGLIDALVHPQILACKKKATLKNEIQQLQTSPGKSTEMHLNGFSKSLKLIMTPLIGIISSKCDVSVHFSCLNTWCYLLHKLDTSINSPSVIKLVLDPMFQAIFKIGPGSKSIWLWNLCLDLLDDCISAKCSDLNSNQKGQVNLCLSASTFTPGPCTSGGYSWKQYPIKWLPWDLSQLDFYLKMVAIIITHVATATNSPERKKLACNAAVRIFISVLKGVQMEFKNPLNNYDNIMFCLNTILKFMKEIGEDASSEGVGDLFNTSLHFIEAVAEELEPSIVRSPLYKVALDIKYVGSLDSVDGKHSKILHQCSIAFMDMVSPMVYLTVFYICLVIQLLTINTPEMELILQRFQSFFKFVLSSDDPLESFLASVGLLYRHMDFNYMEIWMAMVTGLNGYIDDMKDLSLFKTDSDNSVYRAICHLLSYPIILFSCSQKDLTPLKASDSLKESFVSSERKLEQAIEVWKSLYGSVSVAYFKSSAMDTFGGDLCAMLNWCFDENGSMFQYKSELGYYKDLVLACLSFSGKVVICILEQKLTSDTSSCGNGKECVGVCNISSGMNNILEFASRVLKFLYINIGTEPPAVLVSSRVFSSLARFISCLHLKQDILSFFEIISCPLLQWLSHLEIQDESAKDQLGILWAETLNCLQRSWPPITYDSSFLKLQACFLEKTLAHPNSSISDPSIIFWNSTYGKQINLEYPQDLLHVLDKLSRNGRINIHNRSKSFPVRCSTLKKNTAPQSCKVTATQNRSSKRVELEGMNMIGQFNQKDKPPLFSKRKRLELTEHQKEVRRAQQGRERDCSGHAPGIRTYTSLDFSQGNEESHESQDIWDSEAMLEMLRKVG